MRLNRIEIWNLRSIQRRAVALANTMVFVGPNDGGKTAIREASRIALTWCWGQSGTGFTEYDTIQGRGLFRIVPVRSAEDPLVSMSSGGIDRWQRGIVMPFSPCGRSSRMPGKTHLYPILLFQSSL